MASIISFIKAWQVTADLFQELVEAWLKYQVSEVQADHSKKKAARLAIIKNIDKARLERNTDELIALNHALAVLERGKL